MSIEEVRFYQDNGLLPPPRRRRGRSDDLGFTEEHVERLGFIERALRCGLALDDVAEIVSPNALMTCGDVYDVTRRRLEHVRASNGADADGRAAARLERLLAVCPRVGGRHDCKILESLASADC